jgi:RNA polymerase sigma factor (sigma-70 family)
VPVAYTVPLLLNSELPARAQLLAPPIDADAELVRQLQDGSETAFRTLVERYQSRIYRTVFSLLRNAEEAEDVAQEVFVEVYNTIGRFRGEASLSTWLYRLATSLALKNRRRARTKKRFAFLTSLLGFDNGVLPEPPDHAHPLALLEGQQQLQLLLAHIARLPDQQQLAFTLRHEQELSYEQIAAVLGTTVAAVESLLFRARQTLRKHVQPSFRHV